jgi:hypothetical protein
MPEVEQEQRELQKSHRGRVIRVARPASCRVRNSGAAAPDSAEDERCCSQHDRSRDPCRTITDTV